jgi:hypothetical protein
MARYRSGLVVLNMSFVARDPSRHFAACNNKVAFKVKRTSNAGSLGRAFVQLGLGLMWAQFQEHI